MMYEELLTSTHRFNKWMQIVNLKPGEAINVPTNVMRSLAKMAMPSLLVPITKRDVDTIVDKLRNVHYLRVIEPIDHDYYVVYRPIVCNSRPAQYYTN